MDAIRQIEVFADIGCPFTHVGLRRFAARRDELGRDDVVLWVRSWPLEVVNGRPLDPEFIAEEVDDLRSQLGPGDFTSFDPARFPATSLPALALSAAAYVADPRIGERVSLELRDLLFEQARDVADRELLAEVAARYELGSVDLEDHEAVLAEHAEGARRGVVGSPHFFTPGGDFFCPSLDVSRDAHGHLRISADPDGFDAFVTSCLA